MSDEKPGPVGREPMDFDVASFWPFDASPVSPFLLPASPTKGLAGACFAAHPSPPCQPEDRAVEMPEPPSLLHSNPDIINGNFNWDSSKPKRLHICAPEDNLDASCIIKERMTQALWYFKESTKQHVLVQVWAPVKNGDRYVLTTSGQPFILDPQSTEFLQYRTVSLMYVFSVNGENDGDMGLPGRVFWKKQPEWTPNVQYYTCKEYPRLAYALHYNIRGSLALPVFEPSRQSCVGVVELIMTSEKTNYAYEVDKVCKALETVNLKSNEILDHPNIQICNEGCQTALAEILEILTVVCEAHKLPLAQTWVPCRHRSILAHGGDLTKNSSSFDGSCMEQVCMSATDVAFYVIDAHMWGFRDACVEHHLQKGQGVAGRAFELRKPCFSRDITRFCKTEYPLVHYAKMFGLASCLAICLQSTQTGDDEYILEFFLPSDCKDPSKQEDLLDSILTTMKQHFWSLKVVTDVDLEEGISLDIIDMLGNGNLLLAPKLICSQTSETHVCTSCESKPFDNPGDPQNRENALTDLQEKNSHTDDNAEKNENTAFDSNGSGTSGSFMGNKSGRTPEKRRGKVEKSISFDILRQYFSGSLTDAAKSLGVCPTTMKRICRQHGISRWPSRKINKVKRSLCKLKGVIESAQGAEDAFNVTALTCPLPIAVGSISSTVGLDESKQSNGAVRDTEPSTSKIQECDHPCNNHHISLPDLINDQTGSYPEPAEDLPCLKTRSSSGEGSANTPTSHECCHGRLVNKSHLGNQLACYELEHGADIRNSLGFAPRLHCDPNLSTMFSMSDAVITEPQPQLSGMLIEDLGSSEDLNIFCLSVGKRCDDEHLNAFAHNPSQFAVIEDMRTVTIKASYREDIIRFRFPCMAAFIALKDEVAKRLKLEVGLFDIKYLDDDHDWVTLACDADLEECMEISKLSGGHIIRLAVHDIGTTLGSLCESTG